MALKYHEDWQSSKNTVLQRTTYMFDNELMSDISFTCGETSRRIFHAHKYVLATSSAVFFAMFYGDLAQKESTIRLADTDEESLKEFLRFLYTDDCEITAENAIGVMYLAKKYLIPSLAEKCCDVLQASIKPDNVFAVLEQAVKFDEKKLEAKCWDIVSQKTQECVQTEVFCSIGSNTLNSLLKRETLGITEVELFKTVLKWVDKECARQGINIEEDRTARRRILGDSVYEIPFLEMSLEDFGKYVSSTGMLTDAELVRIFQKFSGLEVVDLKWKKKIKIQAQMVAFSRFDISNISTNSWGYAGKSDALSLTVNQVLLFHGVRLFGDPDGSQYEVKFAVKGEKVTGRYTSEQDNDGVWGYDVMMNEPISLQSNEQFIMTATISGPRSCRGNNAKDLVEIDDIVVNFYDAPSGLSKNSTNKVWGQFYKIFLSKS